MYQISTATEKFIKFHIFVIFLKEQKIIHFSHFAKSFKINNGFAKLGVVPSYNNCNLQLAEQNGERGQLCFICFCQFALT